jgi:molybdate transport system ATP-binding protein
MIASPAGTEHPAERGLRVSVSQQSPVPLAAEFDCRAGELLTIVGPSGSGKSTLLRCVAGLHTPARGRIRCNGHTWLDTEAGVNRRPQHRSVGLMFQHYALFPHLSALDNIRLALGHLPAGQRARRAAELMDLVNLGGLEARHPAALSGGQQQRVALARSLARDPEVLLLDEPFSAVDQVTRRKLRAELVQLRSRIDMPIILVTHDLDEARMLSDRICILHHGRTLQAGPPDELMARPATPLVAHLIDHVNVFEARVLEHDAANQLTRIEWLSHRLEAAYRPDYPPGATVAWVIPPENVILHRRDRPSRGDRENPIAATVTQMLPLGETTAIVAVVDGGDASLALSLPTHVARRNTLVVGASIKVSLLCAGIHLMPPETTA